MTDHIVDDGDIEWLNAPMTPAEEAAIEMATFNDPYVYDMDTGERKPNPNYGMVSICSAHRTRDMECPRCWVNIYNMFPDYDQKVAEAEAAGKYMCCKCNFVYYKTTDICPSCGEARL